MTSTALPCSVHLLLLLALSLALASTPKQRHFPLTRSHDGPFRVCADVSVGGAADVQLAQVEDVPGHRSGRPTRTPGVFQPLRANYATTWGEFEIGSPPQKILLQIDTGSALTAIPDPSCAASAEFVYQPEASTSGRYIGCDETECTHHECFGSQCKFHSSYGDGSTITGALISELFSVGPDLSTRTVVGLIHTETGVFNVSHIGGILGLAYNSHSLTCMPNCVTPVMDNLVQYESLPDIFALFLGDSKGQLSWGGWNEQLVNGDIHWTPIKEEKFYTVQLKGLKMDGVELSNEKYKVIVDSGTSFSYLPPAYYNAIVRHFQTHYCDLQAVCGNVTIFQTTCFKQGPTVQALLDRMPAIHLVFEGQELQWLARDYIPRVVDVHSNELFCLGIRPSEKDFILGDTFIRGWYTIFDRKRKRVGFAPVDGDAAREIDSDGDLALPLWAILLISIGGALLVIAAAAIGVFAFLRWRQRHQYEVVE
mmetsp:Transcript_32640/g.81838  ORF Transcript_32640/g.81838 Transcript_32640/m.81838 type:complete len:481 (-) Transcript_32640:298-1740(-)|eukprot:CAMPEP_0177631916 /NCGR_PEP_ID=MMETSP0447-20121125/2006_1 /TAXON_ID=0 /ORGANISM="Stygamoeba regulata, Strain BSH-02190019" /LENGTH=480 /DNA_ID=CAMNT_0019133435 /DNA_START=637 /DNA_END=2079 /DNA_ORIENTATION=+